MRKGILKIALCSMLMAGACYVGYKACGGQNSNGLLLDNVEALANTESSNTTWNCEGNTVFTCGASCCKCKVSVTGTGKLTGEHQCMR